MIRSLKWFLMFGGCLLVAGCTQATVKSTSALTEAGLAQVKDGQKTQATYSRTEAMPGDAITIDDGVYTGDSQSFARADVDPILARQAISVHSVAAVDLRRAAAILGAAIGLPVQVDDSLPAGTGKPLANGLRHPATMIIGDYNGSAQGLLDRVCTVLDCAYGLTRDRLTMRAAETRIWELPLSPFTEDATLSMSAASDIGGSGGGAQRLALAGKSDPWPEAERDLKILLGDTPSSYSMSSSTGQITVTAPPSVGRRVDEWVNEKYRLSMRAIDVSVTFVAWSRNDDDESGLDLAAAFSSASGMFANVVSPTTAVVSSAATATFGASTPKLKGTQAIIRAIAQENRTLQTRSLAVRARNAQIADLSDMHQRSFVKSIAMATSGTTGGTTTSFPEVTPGVVNYGYSVRVLPRIIKGGTRISLSYSVLLTSLDDLTDFPVAAGYSVQQPIVSTFALPIQDFETGSGDTLVLAGLTISDASLSKIGLFSSDSMPGTVTGNHQEMQLIILITPTILRDGA